MNKYTCIIVDDEILAQELIASHLSKIPYIEVVASCGNAIEAKIAIEKHQPDLLFLDIQMPNLSGFDLLRLLKKRPATIITSAFSEYALEGYTLDIIDYILKPIEFERFFKATSKAVEWLERGKSPTDNPTITQTIPAEPIADYLFVKSDYKIVKVIFSEILFIEALQKYVRIHTLHQRVVTLLSMSQLEESLPTKLFVRIHRSYIVNLDKIENVNGNIVSIQKHQIPVSKSQRETFIEKMRQKGLGW